MISTVDPEARHGHKSRNRRFDGYKAHLSIDPDSELIDEVVATPANTPDRDAVAGLLGDHDDDEDKPVVLGDSAYADATTRTDLEADGFELVELNATLQSALRSVPERQRRILHLRFAAGMTQSEIAAEIGVSQMQVSRLLRRSLDQLRDLTGDGLEG